MSIGFDYRAEEFIFYSIGTKEQLLKTGVMLYSETLVFSILSVAIILSVRFTWLD